MRQGHIMKNLAKVLLLGGLWLCLTPNLAFAGDPNYNDAATCVINVTVDQIVEWEGAAYAAINLTTIDDKGDTPDGNSVYTLWLNCDVTLTADNTAAAELDNDPPGSDTLVTEYKVTYDGDGDPDTGGTDTTYETYNNFISGGSAITHYDGDGAVEIRLWPGPAIALTRWPMPELTLVPRPLRLPGQAINRVCVL